MMEPVRGLRPRLKDGKTQSARSRYRNRDRRIRALGFDSRMASTTTTATVGTAPTLRRSLGLWDLILYGIVVSQPPAPMPVFGVVSVNAHVATLSRWCSLRCSHCCSPRSATVAWQGLIPAPNQPSYVGQEIHPAPGYVTGWGMVMERCTGSGP